MRIVLLAALTVLSTPAVRAAAPVTVVSLPRGSNALDLDPGLVLARGHAAFDTAEIMVELDAGAAPGGILWVDPRTGVRMSQAEGCGDGRRAGLERDGALLARTDEGSCFSVRVLGVDESTGAVRLEYEPVGGGIAGLRSRPESRQVEDVAVVFTLAGEPAPGTQRAASSFRVVNSTAADMGNVRLMLDGPLLPLGATPEVVVGTIPAGQDALLDLELALPPTSGELAQPLLVRVSFDNPAGERVVRHVTAVRVH